MSWVRLLHEAAGEVGDPLVRTAAVVDRVLQRDPVLLAQAEVVLAEGNCRGRAPVPSSVVTKSASRTVWPRGP